MIPLEGVGTPASERGGVKSKGPCWSQGKGKEGNGNEKKKGDPAKKRIFTTCPKDNVHPED